MFLFRHLTEIYNGGFIVFFFKIKRLFYFFYLIPLLIIGFIIVIFFRLLSPIIIIRIGQLYSSRLGHFGTNTELYLCEIDNNINKPNQKYIDLFYFSDSIICNTQLALMWKRILYVYPRWLLHPLYLINNILPGSKKFQTGQTLQQDRDICNLTDSSKIHLNFTAVEEEKGKEELFKMGIPYGSKFVCLNVRDSAYLNNVMPGDWSYHNYRDANVDNYYEGIEKLINSGYYVLRMGSIVKKRANFFHRKFIDYASDGFRTDFMDIYLGAKCDFCISNGTGFDSIPFIFKRPILIVNCAPIGYISTFMNKCIYIFKHYINENGIKLNLSQLDQLELLFSTDGNKISEKRCKVLENNPLEIKEAVVEMIERVKNNNWSSRSNNKNNQDLFWKNFPLDRLDSIGVKLHGEVRVLIAQNFLNNNKYIIGELYGK